MKTLFLSGLITLLIFFMGNSFAQTASLTNCQKLSTQYGGHLVCGGGGAYQSWGCEGVTKKGENISGLAVSVSSAGTNCQTAYDKGYCLYPFQSQPSFCVTGQCFFCFKPMS